VKLSSVLWYSKQEMTPNDIRHNQPTSFDRSNPAIEAASCKQNWHIELFSRAGYCYDNVCPSDCHTSLYAMPKWRVVST